MSTFNPLPKDELAKSPLAEMLNHFEGLQSSDSQFLQLMGRVPDYAKALLEVMQLTHEEGSVDHNLKEIIRIQLARDAGDPYFANIRSQMAKENGLTEERIEAGQGEFEKDPQFTSAEKWALRYAHLMFREPQLLGKAFYDEGKTHFTEAQIMELGNFIALHYGMQIFMSTLEIPTD